MPDLAIIIVNYKARNLLRDCLRSILANGGVSYRIFVVDNASNDGSVEMVRQEFPDVVLQALDRNIGYGPANNLGIRMALADSIPPRYILLLNPDTALPADALTQMVAFLETHPEVGAVGPKLVRPDGSLDLACRRSFPTPEVSFYRILGLSKMFPKSRRFARYNLTYLDPDHLTEVDSLVGACMLLRREALEQIGLFDETFFMYGEDLDLCYRLKQHGWKVFYNPVVTVLHYKGESSRQNSARANYEFYRAMLLFHRKHYAEHTFFLVNWLITLAVVVLGGLALLRNAIRPGVGSAT